MEAGREGAGWGGGERQGAGGKWFLEKQRISPWVFQAAEDPWLFERGREGRVGRRGSRRRTGKRRGVLQVQVAVLRRRWGRFFLQDWERMAVLRCHPQSQYAEDKAMEHLFSSLCLFAIYVFFSSLMKTSLPLTEKMHLVCTLRGYYVSSQSTEQHKNWCWDRW